MAYTVMAYIAMAYEDMNSTVMAYVGMDPCNDGLCNYVIMA